MALVLILMPFERLFPRIKETGIKSRLIVILVIGGCTYLGVWLLKNAFYADIIAFFLNFQIVSISKTDFPPSVIFIFSFLLIDFLVYLFHFLSHKINILWKFHSVHHADEHVTASTGLLHHPGESLFSFLFVVFFAVILGIPVLALIAYVGIATIVNFATHSNIAIPAKLNSVLVLAFVTPDLHRTHHSIRSDEGNSNFGQIFTLWDRIFGTFKAHPGVAEERLKMGLPASQKPRAFTVAALLMHPFFK